MKTKNIEESINLEDFVKGFKKASNILKMEKPNYIFAPVSGAVPFIDILNIIDRHFNLNAVQYIPNSSRFKNREELMEKWYSKFYEKNEFGEPIKIVCIDEVLSGSSAVIGYKQFQNSIEERAKKKARGLSDEYEAIEKFKRKLSKNIKYKILGLSERGYKKNPELNRLINKRNIVHLINFDNIPTIDNISYNPIRFKLISSKNGNNIYSPEIERFEITREYLAFLKNISTYVGVDPSTINLVNLSKIEEGLKQSYE